MHPTWSSHSPGVHQRQVLDQHPDPSLSMFTSCPTEGLLPCQPLITTRRPFGGRKLRWLMQCQLPPAAADSLHSSAPVGLYWSAHTALGMFLPKLQDTGFSKPFAELPKSKRDFKSPFPRASGILPHLERCGMGTEALSAFVGLKLSSKHWGRAACISSMTGKILDPCVLEVSRPNCRNLLWK